jgi:hypothetical protein
VMRVPGKKALRGLVSEDVEVDFRE